MYKLYNLKRNMEERGSNAYYSITLQLRQGKTHVLLGVHQYSKVG